MLRPYWLRPYWLRPYWLRPYWLRPYWRDHLRRLALHHREGGAQHLVAMDDLVDAPLQRRQVDRARQAHGDADIVGPRARHELIEKPQPLLRERERGVIGRAAPGDRLRLGRVEPLAL